MQEIRLADGIVPLAAFKSQASRYLKQVAESQSPVVITQNGRAAGVLLSPTAYDLLRRDIAEYERLLEAAASLDAGEYIEDEKVVAWLKTWGTENESARPE